MRVTTLVAVRTSKRALGRSVEKHGGNLDKHTAGSNGTGQRHRDGQLTIKLEGKLTRKFKNDEVEVDPMESHRILRVSYLV